MNRRARSGTRSLRPAPYLFPLLALALMSAAGPAAAQATVDDVLSALTWRNVGPANMMGRVTDVEGIGSPSKTWFFAAAAGGIWKTTNNGITFRQVWDQERVVAMGDLAIAPSDTLQIWAGTGEEDSRNSISPGGGVYKSTDGGLSWEFKGLKETQAIGRIVVHPRNSDVVFVAALGAIWGSNPERGLYRTRDGGESWERVKFISDRAGFVDVTFHPRDPDVLFAASWERVRGPWFLQSGGPGSALWKSTDGGDSWSEVVGGGFPETLKGRIGIAIAPSDPDRVYAMVEAEEGEGSEGNGLYRSDDGGASWQKVNDANTRPFYYSQVRVDPWDADRVYFSSTPVRWSPDGGVSAGNTTVGVHVDHHAMWIDPADPDHIVVGNDGGVAWSWDRGGNWEVPASMDLGQFYHLSYNMDVPYRVCGGLQDNGTWCGPSRRASGGITNSMWATVNGGDGFVTAQHARDPDLVFAESQGGNMARIRMDTRERTGLQKPEWRDNYLAFEDSILVVWDDEDNEPPAAAAERIRRFRELQAADSAVRELRWNWNTPFLLSAHDPDVFYAAANRVLKSTRLGDDLEPVSPDLTGRDPEKIRVSTRTTGGITPDVTGAETHATIVSLEESPLVAGRLYAGTDDGNVWMTTDDGGSWTELTAHFRGLVPDSTYVSRIEASHHDPERFYVTFDNHRRNDFTPYVLVTDDRGRTFRSIAADLPADGPDFVHVLAEDPVNPELLYVGTDVGAYVSLDRGRSWRRFMEGIGHAVPVHDLKVHPRDRELMAATHGRSIWIVDVAPLQQLRAGWVAEAPVLFRPAPALQFGDGFVDGHSTGHQWFAGENRAYGATLHYVLPERPEARQLEVVVASPDGSFRRTLEGPARAGLNTVTWNFRGDAPPPAALSPAERRDSLRTAALVRAVADSLVEHEGADRAQVDRLLETFGRGRGFGGFGGGAGGGASGAWNDRPGETAAVRTPGGGGAGGGPGGASPSLMRQIFGALRDRGMSTRSLFGGGGGGAGAPLAEPGRYRVTLTVDGTAYETELEVVRSPRYRPDDGSGEAPAFRDWDDVFRWVRSLERR
ncbi:MAG: hypothetical protein RQ751_02570 [Longimicrobiales bacterium]|nr:hypothetical protein [Longimicrobiales bacterium]